MSTTETPQKTLTPDEKMEQSFTTWLAAEGFNFTTPEAERDYRARIQRVADAMRLKTPDRVPVTVMDMGFGAAYYKISQQELMYDTDKAIDVMTRYTMEFQPDAQIPFFALPGRVFDGLDYKLFDWPGHNLGPDAGFQFNEDEYMIADDYDRFIQDPSDYWLRVHLPRTLGGLEPLKQLMPLTNIIEQIQVVINVSSYGLPDVQEALKKLMQAGSESLAYLQKMGLAGHKLAELGYPNIFGGITYAPFDLLGDTLRGTKGIMIDMYRRPEKLQEALERVTPMMIRDGVTSVMPGGIPMVMIPLHKGADSFMSDEQFKTFYWPSLRKVIMALIEEGIMPLLFAEGGYNDRLEVVRDLPKGKTVWYFDFTDMERAKEALGDVACLQGNVPSGLMYSGTPEDMKAYCQNLIKVAGKGGGYIMTTGVGVGQNARAENVRAMVETAKEYGVYS